MKNRLIQLEQIEHGIELLNALNDLKIKVAQLGMATQYLTDSNEIHLTKSVNTVSNTTEVKLTLDQEYIKELKEDIMDMILNVYEIDEDTNKPTPKVYGVVQDILHKLEILLNRETLYKKITDTLTVSEREQVEYIVQTKMAEEIAKSMIDLQTELQRFVNQQIKDAKDELNNTIDALRSDLNTVDAKIGTLNNLHPYLVEAVGENHLTVKDVINLLFQIIIDLNNNIVSLNNSQGTQVDLVNTYNVELPDDYGEGKVENPGEVSTIDTFSLKSDLGSISTTNDESVQEFNSIADEILYRKNLNSLK